MLYMALPAISLSMQLSALQLDPALYMDVVIVAYIVAFITFTPLTSWLCGCLNEKTVYVISLATFIAGSLWCAFASSLSELVTARFIQGIGGALMLPVIKTVLLKITTPSLKLMLLNRVTLMGIGGVILGPVLAGFLIAYFSWRVIFMINVPIAFACLFMARTIILDLTKCKQSFSHKGYFLIVGALLLFLFGVMTAGKPYIQQQYNLMFFLCAALLILVYKVTFFDKNPDGTLNALLRIKTFAIALRGSMMSRILISSTPVVLSTMLQTKLGFDSMVVSMIMLSFSMGFVFSKLMLEKLLQWLGFRYVLMLSTVLTAISIMLLCLSMVEKSIFTFAVLNFMFGWFSSTLYSSLNILAFSDLTDDTYNSGNSVITVVQLMSIAVSTSLSFLLLRFFSAYEIPLGVSNYGVFFLVVAVILPSCCFLFSRLNQNDGRYLIQGS